MTDTAEQPGLPLYYRLLNACSADWGRLSTIETAAGLNPMATPHRRKLLDLAVSLAHLEARTRGQRREYHLTPVGERYLDLAFEAYGP